MIEGSGSVKNNDGSGFGRPKNIRGIRIHNTAQGHKNLQHVSSTTKAIKENCSLRNTAQGHKNLQHVPVHNSNKGNLLTSERLESPPDQSW